MDQHGLVPWMPASAHPHDPKTSKQRREEALLQPFYEEERRQEDARRSHKLKNMEAVRQMRENQRNLIHQNFHENAKRRRIQELCAFSMHASLLTSWNLLENQDYETKVGVFEKMSSQEDLELNVDRINFEKDLKLFESKGYALGEEAMIDLSTDSSKEKGKVKRKDNNQKLKETKGLKKDGMDPLAVIKERVLICERERLEMEQKQKLNALAQKQIQKEVEESTMKDEENRKASKDIQERLLSEEELRKEEIKEKEQTIHRLELGQLLLEQRNREWEAVLARDHELLLMMKHDRDNEINFEQSLWQAERLKKLEQKQLKHKLLCQEVVLQIASLAENAASYKESTKCILSSMEWWEWKTLFVKGAVQPIVLNIQSSPTNDTMENAAEAVEEAAVLDYIKEKGEWKVSEPLGTNKELGKILISLFKIIDTASNATPPPFLASIQLKLAAVGGPFTGKTFVSKVLEEKFGIVRIEVEKIIASAVAAAETEEPKNCQAEAELSQSVCKINDRTVSDPAPCLQESNGLEDVKTPNISPRLSLAREAQAAVLNGLQVPDEVIVKLLLLTLENLDDYAASTALGKDKKKKEQSSKDPKGTRPQKSPMPSSQGKASKEKNISTQETNQPNKRINPGFILDGFPRTQRQAVLLEKALRGQELCLESNKSAYVSIIASPPDSREKAGTAEYSLDALFALEPLSEADALKQAMGKVIDPKSGILYHLDYKPPPSNDRTGIASRLKPVEEINAAGKRIKEAIPLWNKLYDWISTFSNTHLVCHGQEKNLKMEDVYTRIQEILDAKTKVSAAEDAATAAIEADMAATQSCIEAEKASLQAKAIAQKLFLAKLAEVETLTVLEKDTPAKDVMKKKVTESTSKLLQDAVKAAKEAEGFTEAARKAAADALNAKLNAEEAVSSVFATIQAKEKAYSAAMIAKQSMDKACAAAERAQVAAESASVSVADMNSSVENTDRSFLKEKIISLSKQPMKNEVEIAVSGQENDTLTVQVDQTFAENLCRQWQDIEATYLQKLKELFSNLWVEQQETQKTLKEAKNSFVAYLKKPDERQAHVDDFQAKYNRVDASQRSTPKMQKQLQKKAEDLFSKLHSICEDFFKVAVSTCKTSLTEWMKKRSDAVSQIFTIFIQIEFERFLHTCCLLHEYYFKEPTISIKEKFSNAASLSNPGKQSKLLTMPGWLPSISESLPQLYQVLYQTILSIDSIVKITIEPQNSNSNPKITSKQAKETKKTNSKEQPKLEEHDYASKAIQDERQILILRFERIVSKACGHICNLDALVEGARTQMENWIDKSHKTKFSVTEEVINIVQEAISESIPLWYYMPLDGENVSIDETRTQLESPQPTGTYPLPSLASYHIQVLQDLLKAFQADSIKGYISLNKAAELINEVIDSVHSACKNDPMSAMIPRMPGTKNRPGGPFEIWRDYSKQLLKITSKNTSEVVDWRCLIVSFIDVHYHSFISTASVNDIVEAYSALQEVSNGGDGNIDLSQYLSVKLWFDSGDGSDAGAEVKTLLYNMLDSGSGIPWKSLLLYLCKDADTELALKKAHAALTGISSESVSLQSLELLQAIYPSGIEGAVEIGCQIWSLNDIEKLIEALQSKEQKKKTDLGANETMKALNDDDDDDEAENQEYEDDEEESNTEPNSMDARRGSKFSQHSSRSYTTVQSDTQEVEGISCSNQDAWIEKQNELEDENSTLTLTIPSDGLPSTYESTTPSYTSNVLMSGTDKVGPEMSEDQYSTEFSDNALITMNDFLASCDEALSNKEVRNEEGTKEEGESLLPVTLQGLLASDLSPILRARFATDSVLSIPACP